MPDYIYFSWDVNDEPETDDQEAWEAHANHVPSKFVRLVCAGVDVDTAAAIADDGRPVCDNPPEVAEDGELAWIWAGMYEEVA